jgi:hypothetical protein
MHTGAASWPRRSKRMQAAGRNRGRRARPPCATAVRDLGDACRATMSSWMMNADSASHSIHCIRETYQAGAVGAYDCALLSPEEVGAIENCLRTVAMGGRLPVFGLQIPTTTGSSVGELTERRRRRGRGIVAVVIAREQSELRLFTDHLSATHVQQWCSLASAINHSCLPRIPVGELQR